MPFGELTDANRSYQIRYGDLENLLIPDSLFRPNNWRFTVNTDSALAIRVMMHSAELLHHKCILQTQTREDKLKLMESIEGRSENCTVGLRVRIEMRGSGAEDDSLKRYTSLNLITV